MINDLFSYAQLPEKIKFHDAVTIPENVDQREKLKQTDHEKNSILI